MYKKLLALLAASASMLVLPAAAQATNDNEALGFFNQSLFGATLLQQNDTTVRVRGIYTQLPRNRSFFTVAYANRNCDPAQAVPFGPFNTDRRGRGFIDVSSTQVAGFVAGTLSISVRRGDNNRDLDGDGIKGPGDVVAVPGNPGVGLVECDSNV